jgi:hypothetical protein
MAKRTGYSEYHDQNANHGLELDQDGILFEMVAEPAV